MSLLNFSILSVCCLILTACSVNSSSMPPTLSSSTPQIQKFPIEISCQDLQNPAFQQAILNTINQFASNHASVVSSIFLQLRL